MGIIDLIGISVVLLMLFSVVILLVIIGKALMKYKRWKTKREWEAYWEMHDEWQQKKEQEQQYKNYEYNPYNRKGKR